MCKIGGSFYPNGYFHFYPKCKNIGHMIRKPSFFLRIIFLALEKILAQKQIRCRYEESSFLKMMYLDTIHL